MAASVQGVSDTTQVKKTSTTARPAQAAAPTKSGGDNDGDNDNSAAKSSGKGNKVDVKA